MLDVHMRCVWRNADMLEVRGLLFHGSKVWDTPGVAHTISAAQPSFFR